MQTTMTTSNSSLRHCYCTGFSTTASFDADTGFPRRLILFSHACCSNPTLSVALCFSDGSRGDDKSVLDSADWGCEAQADGQDDSSSESWDGLASDDKLLGETKALPAFFCSSKIFCKYLACSSIRNWRALCTYAKDIETATVKSNGKVYCGPEDHNLLNFPLALFFLYFKGQKHYHICSCISVRILRQWIQPQW